MTVGPLAHGSPAHDRAVRLLPAGTAPRRQQPLLAATVVLTVGAVSLVSAP